MTGTCARCHRNRHIKGRGLCDPCYVYACTHRLLDQWPRRRRPGVDLVEDWHELSSQGYTRRHAAERLGVTKQALDKAIARHTPTRGDTAA